MNNINEIDLKISKLNLEKDISFHKHQIDDYKSQLFEYDMNSNYHQYLLKKIEIRLLEINISKIKLEEIDKKYDDFSQDDTDDQFSLKSNFNEVEYFRKKIESEI